MNEGLFLHAGKFESVHGKLRGSRLPFKIVVEALLFRCHLVELALALSEVLRDSQHIVRVRVFENLITNVARVTMNAKLTRLVGSLAVDFLGGFLGVGNRFDGKLKDELLIFHWLNFFDNLDHTHSNGRVLLAIFLRASNGILLVVSEERLNPCGWVAERVRGFDGIVILFHITGRLGFPLTEVIKTSLKVLDNHAAAEKNFAWME